MLAVSVAADPGGLTVSVPDAGRLLGLSNNATWQAIYRGEISSLIIGRRRLVPLVPLLRLRGAEDDAVRDVVLQALMGPTECPTR